MIIVVSGGRDYLHRQRAYQVLDAAVERLGMSFLIHGKCETGLDAIAEDWAISRKIEFQGYPADWRDLSQPGSRLKYDAMGRQYDAAAGGRRNQLMLDDGKPDVAIVFPGHHGTNDFLRRARIEKSRRQLAGGDLRIIDIDRH